MGLSPTRRVALQSALQLGQQINLLRQSSPDTANGFIRIQSAFDQVDRRIRDLAGAMQSLLGTGNEFVATFRRVNWYFPGMQFQIYLPSIPGVVFPGAALSMNWPGYNMTLELTPFGMAYRVNNSGVAIFAISPDPVTAGGIISVSTAAGVPQFQAGNGSVAAISLLVGSGSGGPSVTGTGKLQHLGDTIGFFNATRSPSSSVALGADGEVCFDNTYLYYRSGGSWRRIGPSATF